MDWNEILRFARGPLFRASFLVFVGGMAYRLLRVLLLRWPVDRVPSGGSKLGGAGVSFLKGALIWPFLPWVRNTFTRSPLIYLAGGLFHLSLFTILLLGTPHMLVWKSLLKFGWPTLPLPVIDWLAATGIAAMIALLINRMTHPVIRLITGPAEWLNWLLVFLPMVTGYIMTHHLFFRYQVLFSLHMLTVDLLFIWIPFSRIPHFLFYFFSRAIHGAQFGKRGVRP